MIAQHPPELEGFHAKNMLHALFVFLIPAVAGGWAFYRQETFEANDNFQSVLEWVFMIGVGLFMLTILFKALVFLPRCPECRRKMVQLRTISIVDSEVFGMKSESKWRVVECPNCHEEYRIPGLSQG